MSLTICFIKPKPDILNNALLILNQMCIGVCVVHQVATQFKGSLGALMEALLSKEPSYVRCIKPNDEKSPGLSVRILHVSVT